MNICTSFWWGFLNIFQFISFLSVCVCPYLQLLAKETVLLLFSQSEFCGCISEAVLTGFSVLCISCYYIVGCRDLMATLLHSWYGVLLPEGK